jgi:hypothetical protein
MRIGLAGPCSLPLLSDLLPAGSELVPTYSFPYISEIARAYLGRGYGVDIVTGSAEIDRPMVIDAGALRVFVGRRRSRARARA